MRVRMIVAVALVMMAVMTMSCMECMAMDVQKEYEEYTINRVNSGVAQESDAVAQASDAVVQESSDVAQESDDVIPSVIDLDWSDVPVLLVDHVWWTEDAGVRASGQLCYDDEYLYVHLAAVEKDIRAVNTEPMSPVYEDSCLEFFFMLPDAGNYFNFEVNPNGCLNIQFGPKKATRFFLVSEDAADYFDVHADRTADGWEVYYRIPITFIRLFYPEFVFDGIIRANVYKCGNKTVQKHYLAWNPVNTDKPNFHRPEDFGIMYFEP